jgi:hypothetical protein
MGFVADLLSRHVQTLYTDPELQAAWLRALQDGGWGALQSLTDRSPAAPPLRPRAEASSRLRPLVPPGRAALAAAIITHYTQYTTPYTHLAGAPIVARLERLQAAEIADKCASSVFEEGGWDRDPSTVVHACSHEPRLLYEWCCAAIARAGVQPGLAHVLGLPDLERLPVARLLLHAATCHFYASAEAAAGYGSAGGGGGGGSCGAWPYREACCEPLFASLRPQHQWWLISDVLAALWAPQRRADDG